MTDLVGEQATLSFDDECDGAGPDAVHVDRTFGSRRRIRLDDTSWLDHVGGWLTGDRVLLRTLMDEAPWEQRSRWMFTRTVLEPRLTAEHPVVANAPQRALHDIAAALSAEYGRPFTRLWMNWYRDHNDGTGWHADRPANQEADAVIPVLSLGATRRFQVKPIAGGSSTFIVVRGGDLVVMGGRCQRDYHHAVPKEASRAGPRVSLNFSIDLAHRNAPR